MLDYVFFQDEPRQRFIAHLAGLGIRWTQEVRDPETLVTIDDTELDDHVSERIEIVYDELLAMEQALYDASHSGPEYAGEGSGVVATLSDGRTVYAHLPTDLVSRVLMAITPDELAVIVEAVAEAVEGANRRRQPQAQGIGDL
jgi:hypothetical protein